MPDLSNVHLLERGFNWSTVAYVVFICLAAAAGFLLAVFAGRVTAAKDIEIGRLHEQAALARREQDRVEAEIAHARTSLEELRKENTELELAVEKERAARLRLEALASARHLTPGQKQTIESALARFRGQRFSMITYAGDPESFRFASDIKATLEAAGMSVSVAPALVFGKPQAGIALEVGAHRQQVATALAKAFVDAGVCTGPIVATEAEDADLLEITVGPKP
ncbi:MAG TPA: hypothetical protein VKR61_06170 [Bryobacteraceae bacterium]|nr:hypothetical protein [Bryobacteraceae bacterium]